MGLTDAEHARLQEGLSPIIPEAKTEKQTNVVEDATIGNTEILRGIPAVGRVSGTIKGTRPGDTAAALQRANQDLHDAMMRRARTNLRGADKP